MSGAGQHAMPRGMRLVFAFAILIAGSACQQEPAPASAPAPQMAPATPTAQKAQPGSGLPFATGKAPKIEDLPVDDLGKFLRGTSWCRREHNQETRIAFNANDTWSRDEEQGTWRAEGGRLVLETADGKPRTVDVQAGKVDGKPVVAFDGLLHGECEPVAR